jgi:hypothetical protein
MTWTASEILDMLRRAKELGALSPHPHADPQPGEMQQTEPNAGIDPAGEPVHQPHPDSGPEV